MNNQVICIYEHSKCTHTHTLTQLIVMLNQMLPHYVIVCVHMDGVRGNLMEKPHRNRMKIRDWCRTNICHLLSIWCIDKFIQTFVYIIGGVLALTEQSQYGHLYAQFYGRNAKPTEFGFILGDYIVYRLFSISLCTSACDESQTK